MQLKMPRFKHAKVLVIGDVMLDRYWHGASSRISPEAPVPVVNVSVTEDRPGGAANVALNLAALGCEVSLLGVIGNDEAGRILEQQLVDAEISTHLYKSSAKPTITKLRVISRHQQLLRMDFEEQYLAQDAAQLVAQAEALMHGMDIVILSDYAKGSLQDCPALIHMAQRLGVQILVDPKSNHYEQYAQASILTPNLQEFEVVVGTCNSELEIATKGQALLEKLQLKGLLITRGEQGMTLLLPGMQELNLPARAREVFDVTGAGDTVIATLAASLAAGSAVPEATAVANLAAGIVVGKLGTATVSEAELRWAVYAEQGFDSGVVTEEQLLMALVDARANGSKIVFTNGCFDILHAGHVSYLEAARKLGDQLIVAVNSDKSVRRLKGEERPINNVQRRMAVLAGLGSVDWVIEFDEDTPERLIELIKPDVLVKGGDYTEAQVVGAELVNAYGGAVKVLHFFDGCSTTAIVNQLRKTSLQ